MRGTVRAGAIAAVLLLVASGAACGYGLVGRTTVLPERIRVIAVTQFENQTRRPEIEQRVTEEVARELSKRGRYRVVPDRSGADALLEGTVADFQTNPVQFNEQGRATRVEAIVAIRATLVDLSTEDILWSQSGLMFREQYDVSDQDVSSTGGFIDQETIALDEIARGAAGALVTSILEGF